MSQNVSHACTHFILINVFSCNNVFTWKYWQGRLFHTLSSVDYNWVYVAFYKLLYTYLTWEQGKTMYALYRPSLFLVVVILFPEEYNRTHSICITFIKSFHKCIPLAVAREAEAHRADNRYFNNDTAGGKQGARGDILLFPDVSSTLHYQNEWFNINGSDIYL